MKAKKEQVSDMKICPACEYEYHSHVERCAECGGDLIGLEEHRRAVEERERLKEEPLENPVAVREGDPAWMGELLEALVAAGIAARLFADPGCAKGCRGNTVKLLVSEGDAPRAHERCEEYFSRLHPEALASRDRMEEGKCPACGSETGPSATECPDCGLALIVIE